MAFFWPGPHTGLVYTHTSFGRHGAIAAQRRVSIITAARVLQMKRLLILCWLAAAGATSSSDAPLAGSTPSSAAAVAATATGAAPAAATTNATRPPDAANATATNANATAPNATAGRLHGLRDRFAALSAPNISLRPSLRPVRKKLANLTGLHGFVSNKNNGSAANRIKTIFASSAVENATVNTTNTTLPPLAPPCATVACVTWNLAATSPSSKDAKFLERLRRHDLVCICVQELEVLTQREK